MGKAKKSGKGMKATPVYVKTNKPPERGTVAYIVYQRGKKTGESVFITASN